MHVQSAVPGDISSDWSWWRRDIEGLHGANLPPLVGRIVADVVIVGGGFTGMWTALTLKERNPALKVVLLEATKLGDGASSRNGGIVHGYWQSLPANIRSFGLDVALELARLGSRAQTEFKKFVTAPGREVWWQEFGNVRIATCAAQENNIKKFLGQCHGLGVEDFVRPLTKHEVSMLVSGPVFGSGIFFPEAGNVHPGRLVVVLKKAVVDAGVIVHEYTPVKSIEGGQAKSVLTKEGRVDSSQIVLATNVGLAGVPQIARNLSLFSSYATMSYPCEESLARVNWEKPFGGNDARMFLHYFRKTRDHRVLMGSGSGPLGHVADELQLRRDVTSYQRTRAGMRRLLPDIADAAHVQTWGWPIDVSADRVPFFKSLKPGIHYAAGFSGHGVQAAWIAGQCLSSLVLGEKDEWYHSPFCQRDVPNFPPEPFKYWGASAIRSAILACEESEQIGKRASYLAQSVAALPNLLGLRVGVR